MDADARINWIAVGATILPNVGLWCQRSLIRKNTAWFRSVKCFKWTPGKLLAYGLHSGIGTASYLVYRDGGGFVGPAKLPLILYGSNLVLNWAWAPILFGMHNVKGALAEIQLVNITAIATGILFYKINKTAGYLFIPYVVCLGIGTVMTYKIYKHDPKPDDIERKLALKPDYIRRSSK